MKSKKYILCHFEKGYYERPLLGAKNIPVRGGNRDYTVTVQKYRCFKHRY